MLSVQSLSLVAGKPGSAAIFRLPAARSRPTLRRGALCVQAIDEKDSRDNLPSPRAIPPIAGRRERVVGRIAMLGVAAAWVGEILTGLGPLHQVSYETSLPYGWVQLGAVAAGTWLLFGSLRAANTPTYNKSLTGKGTEKTMARNEVILGRLAMMIFAGACLLELAWGGQSPLAHLGIIEPGTGLENAPLLLKISLGVFVAGGLGAFSAFSRKE